jgi:SPP1 gp7 family putative phage head morphogenesis protein
MAVNANTQIYDKTVDRAAMIRLYERRVNGKVELIIDGHAERVDKLIREAKTSGKGFEKLREAIDQDIRRTFNEAYQTSKRSLLDLSNDQYSFTYSNLDKAMGDIWRTQRPVNPITEDFILKNPLYKNKTLEQGWTGIAISERKRIESVIRRGLAEGINENEIANLVRKEAGYKISKFQAKTLVITSITSVRSQVDQSIYEANKNALRGWQYVAVLDSRTTPLCAHRDGTIYPASDTVHLPPAHFHCRSTTVPVFKSWDDIAKLESVAEVRRRNLENLTKKQVAFYDGQTPLRETYDDWLRRQPKETQLRHLGDYQKVDLFRSGGIKLNKFTNDEGNSIGIRELRRMTDDAYTLPNDTRRFAIAKLKLDSMQLWATNPDDFIKNDKLRQTLLDYYLLQTTELDGTLSLTNYRGTLIGVKKATKNRVLSTPPTEKQLVFNPVTGRYHDIRLFQPDPEVLANNLKLVRESDKLLARDKDFIEKFIGDLGDRMSINERAVITDNLRILFGRYRQNKELWGNFKAVAQSQIKFDVMNISDALETHLRRNADILKRLLNDNYIDPVLGPIQLDDIHDNFISNIIAKNKWEDKIAPKIANELRTVFDRSIINNPIIWSRLDDSTLQQFYLRFVQRLSLADMPDRDQFAVAIGRDLYNLANLNGDHKTWHKLGMKLLESKNVSKFFEVETYGVQKRRMRSRIGGKYFGPYYDTTSYNIRITDERIQDYAKLTRKVELGFRVPFHSEKNRLILRPGYKTYWIDRGVLGYEDTRFPITSTSSFGDFPEDFVDKNFVDAMNWAAQSKFKIDQDYFDFINKLLYFADDKGKAKYYEGLNEYRKYIVSRGDSYERFKAMEWLRKRDLAFANNQFIDHRARIYERGLIGPQAGETFRPFLNTEVTRPLGIAGYKNFRDQVGSFLGGLNDQFEGRYNSLSFTGRQKIAQKWWPELVKIGNHMLRGKPADIRIILENKTAMMVDGEELGKFYRLAIEAAKIDKYLNGNYTPKSLERLADYKTALALEQDASSSGAQIIALTTKNKQLAELSNVIPTNYKRRLYDEIAADTYNDPRFRKLNEKLNLTEKDLRKAAKAQNMVTFYGAGERTGALNVEGKLSKILGKDTNVLVVKASDRDTVLNEISARMARYEKFDTDTYLELKTLREQVKDIFNRGLPVNDEIMDQLYFLDSKTRDLVEKLSLNYSKVVTPTDFKDIAAIMSEYLGERVPILKEFTRFFGRLAEDFLANAKPSSADFDWKTIAKTKILGSRKKGYVLPDYVSRNLGLKAGEPVSEKVLKRFGFWKPDGTLSEIIYGVKAPDDRRTGAKYFKVEIAQVKNLYEFELFYANKLPKSWTNVPWINFDGKRLEQNFTQTFEQRLVYRDEFGNWTTNILQVPQKTEASWWEQVINKNGKINDIADITKARTAYAVNGNHSNDATLVKNFHLWGKKNNVPTATVHDAFFTNIGDMLKGRKALRQLYANTLEANIVKDVLDEMLARGLPKSIYNKYLEEAISIGLIPVSGKSKVGNKTITKDDILKAEDILRDIKEDFSDDYGWYGVG